jgi:peptidoglycan/LPS O-acetylase OafA/YrhL
LRAVAVLLVLAAHMPQIAGNPLSHGLWEAMHAIRSGYVGVDLFFVLSGFLITRILLAERAASGRIAVGSFYLKRVLRIAPIYYLCIAFCAAYFGLDWSAALSLATFTFNFYHPLHPAPHPLEHTWSLGVEQQFYLVWPFLIAAMRPRWGRVATGAAIPALAVMAAAAITWLYAGQTATDLIYMTSPTRMLSLSLGGYIAFREFDGEAAGIGGCLGWLAFGVLTMAVDTDARRRGGIAGGGMYWTIALVGSAAASAALLAALAICRAWVFDIARATLGWAPLRYIGKISYGLYLYHLIVLFALGLNEAALGGSGVTAGQLGLALGLSFAIAAVSYAAIERPLLAWGGHWLRASLPVTSSALTARD